MSGELGVDGRVTVETRDDEDRPWHVMLSDEQIERFKTHGYLVLKNVFDAACLDDWREQIWRIGKGLLDNY